MGDPQNSARYPHFEIEVNLDEATANFEQIGSRRNPTVLELCIMVRSLESAIIQQTGMPPDQFLSDMRKLLGC